MRQRRLADGCAVRACACAGASAHSCTYSRADRRMHDARSVSGDGRRLLREWRLDDAAARWSADAHADARANAVANTGARAGTKFLHDSGPVRRDGRWILRERWLAYAAARGRGHADPDADAHSPFG